MVAGTYTRLTMPITIETSIFGVTLEHAWECWTKPEHITQWNFASPEWECPKAENDLREGGTFTYVMSAKDKSFSFDFGGTYTTVKPWEFIAYTIADGRKVTVNFTVTEQGVKVVETFEPEHENPEELQRGGWQSVLDTYAKHTQECRS